MTERQPIADSCGGYSFCPQTCRSMAKIREILKKCLKIGGDVSCVMKKSCRTFVRPRFTLSWIRH